MIWQFNFFLITHMYAIATTYGVVNLILLGGFAYLTFKMTSKK